jgi:hypothetical protein
MFAPMSLHVEGEEQFERIGITGCLVIIVGMLIACNSVQGAAPPPFPPLVPLESAFTKLSAPTWQKLRTSSNQQRDSFGDITEGPS